MFFAGIDIGIQSVNAVLIDINGNIIATAQQSYPIKEPETGYREQDAEVIKNAVFSIIMEIIGKSGQPDKVQSICFSAAMHSIMAADENGNPLTPLLIWSDTRSNDEADDIRYDRDATYIYQHGGNPIHPSLPLTKIKWLKQNQKELFAVTHKFISIKEYISFHLLGKYIVDYTTASATGLFDILELKWNRTALDAAGIDYELLSEPIPTSAYSNKWRDEVKTALNLPANTVFVSGSSDNCFVNVASHVIPNRDIALYINDTASVTITSPEPFIDSDETISNHILGNNLFISGGESNYGCSVFNWLKDFLKAPADAVLPERCKKIDAGSEGLVILPYLDGERSPIWDTKAKMIVYGMQAHHTQEHFCRAMLEAMVMNTFTIAQKLIKQQPTINRVIISGSVTQFPLLLQMVADIFNLPVHVLDNKNPAAYGAALWGGYSLGILTEKTLAPQPAAKVYQPEDWNHDFYMDNYAIFKDLYNNNKY